MNPQTVPEWAMYIQSLTGSDLRSKAMAANQVHFVRMLEEDGLSPTDISEVFRLFAQRLVDDGQQPPSRVEGTYIDYNLLVPA